MQGLFNALAVVLLLLAACATASPSPRPKKYVPEEGFQPSLRYYEQQMQNQPNDTTGTAAGDKQGKASKDEPLDRLQRFGTSALAGYGNTGTGAVGYTNNAMAYGMAPLKIDIGGIALGALIGLGAILIVPKLAHIFSTGGYGYRSLENDMSSISDLLARVDNSLEAHNIDSSSCMQRIICSYVHEAQKEVEAGKASTVDQLVFAVSNNSLFTYLLDGSTIKQAIDMGKQNDLEKCASLYTKCPVSKENVMQIIGTLLPA